MSKFNTRSVLKQTIFFILITSILLTFFIWIGLKERNSSRLDLSVNSKQQVEERLLPQLPPVEEKEAPSIQTNLDRIEEQKGVKNSQDNIKKPPKLKDLKEIVAKRRLTMERFHDFQKRVVLKLKKQKEKRYMFEKVRLKERHLQEKNIKNRENRRLQKINKEMFWKEKMIDLEVQRRIR